jgi:hypothetical protein
MGFDPIPYHHTIWRYRDMTCHITTVREVIGHGPLKRCTTHGIAWVEDGKTGTASSPHPNTGTKAGSVRLGYERPVTCHGWTYETATRLGHNEKLTEIAANACRCGGVH